MYDACDANYGQRCRSVESFPQFSEPKLRKWKKYIRNWPLAIGAFQDQYKETMINKHSNKHNHTLSSAEAQRVFFRLVGSKGFFSGGEDPLRNVSAGTGLQATAERAGASARYHTQDGRDPGETIFCALLPGMVCVPCVMVKMAGKILRFSDV